MALAAAAALAGAALQSATGFGFALVVSPALFAVLDPYEAVSALLILGLVLNLLVLFDVGRAGPARWRMLAPVLIAALPGLGLGLLALDLLSKPWLQIGVGAAVIATALWQLSRRTRGVEPDPERTRASAAIVGLTSGALTTSISVSGPPLLLWLESRGLSPAELRASLAAAFLALNLAGGVLLVVAHGVGEMPPAGTLAGLLALVVVGHFGGASAFRRLDQRRFTLIALGVVGVAGLASLIAGAAAL